MEFLSPTALFSFLLLPLLLLPYLIRRRPRRLVFSSLLLLKEFSASSAPRPWRRFLLPPIFFLQLLLLLLLMLALAEPVFSVRPLKTAIVIDNSASMQALAGGRSRFEIAREEARERAGRLPARSEIDVYRTVPALEPVGEKALTPDRAAALIATLVPYDLADAQTRDHGRELADLVQSEGYEQLLLWTDRPAAGTSSVIQAFSVGQPEANLALTSLELARRSFASPQWSATAVVANFSPKEQRVTVALKGAGEPLSSRGITVPPGQSARVLFEELPHRSTYEAEIQEKDSLPLDNRRFAVPKAPGPLRVLGVSPRPQALKSLRSVPGLSIEVILPEAYAKAGGGGHDLEIFHYSAPAVLPDIPALFILPPEENPIVSVGETLSSPVISGWRESHRLTRYVNFALLRPGYARALEPRSFGDPVVESAGGPLAVAVERPGVRYLALGFDPFPYLGEKNLPVSIFTLNFLEWFNQAAGQASAHTGEPLRFSADSSSVVVRTPRGDELPLEEGAGLFSQTFFQGVYQMRREGTREFKAFNLEPSGESDLSRPLRIQLREESTVAPERLSLRPLWPYLLIFALFLLILEWFWNPPVLSRPVAISPAKEAKAR